MAKLVYGIGRDEDPIGMLLCLDFFALKAGEFEWVGNLWNECGVEKGLSLLPNWYDYFLFFNLIL